MIVLDTHAWLWWASAAERLSAPARAAIEQSAEVGVCTISCWELAMLEQRGRIALDRPVRAWVHQALAHDRVKALPLTPDDAIDAALLANVFPGDPADRVIYATARRLRWPLITRDDRLQAFDPAMTIW